MGCCATAWRFLFVPLDVALAVRERPGVQRGRAQHFTFTP